MGFLRVFMNVGLIQGIVSIKKWKIFGKRKDFKWNILI